MRRNWALRPRVLALALLAALGISLMQYASPQQTAQASTTNFADNFNRADSSTIGNSWVESSGDWALSSGALTTVNSYSGSVLSQSSVALGAKFTVSADIKTTSTDGARRWNGIAFNIHQNVDGTLNYYVFRMGPDTSSSTGQWQLLQFQNSTLLSVVDKGTVHLSNGVSYTLQATATTFGTYQLQISNGASVLTTATSMVPKASLLIGGSAGIYSNSGYISADNASIVDTDPAQFSDDFNRPDGAASNGWSSAAGTWSIVGQQLVSTGSASPSLIQQPGTSLGDAFAVQADVATISSSGSRFWNGIAFNINKNTDGTYNYYVFRLGSQTATNAGAWQLLQVTNSQISATLDSGSHTFAANKPYTLQVIGTTYGAFTESVYDGTTLVFTANSVASLSNLLIGGSAGIYSNTGSIGADNFSILSSSSPAAPRNSSALDCTLQSGLAHSYALPSAGTIVSSSLVGQSDPLVNIGESVLTHGTDQYVAYYNADHNMAVAHRNVSSNSWTTKVLDNTLGWDSHNYVTMAVDSAGQLHVSGNMHAQALTYYRTTTPGDVTTLTRLTTLVSSADEQAMTYPNFLQDSAGNLIYSYREGVSGNGNFIYDKYTPATQTWSRLISSPLLDGQGLRSAYPSQPVLGPDGLYHMLWYWRDTGHAETVSNLSYAQSSDLVNWTKSDGTPLGLPFTYSNGELVDAVPMNGGAINGDASMGFDAAGHVLISYIKYDSSGQTQLWLARLTGSGWHTQQVSAWSGRWVISGTGSLAFPVHTLSPTILADGNIRLDYTCNSVGYTYIVNAGSLATMDQVQSPVLPGEITTVRSSFPGMIVGVFNDLGSSGTANQRYVLRRETLPVNGDQPRSAPYPDPSDLQVYLLGN